jgi:hypothetical protein
LNQQQTTRNLKKVSSPALSNENIHHSQSLRNFNGLPAAFEAANKPFERTARQLASHQRYMVSLRLPASGNLCSNPKAERAESCKNN